MEDFNLFLNDVIKTYVGRYDHILGRMYPSKGPTGFPEVNLSVNYSRAYDTVLSSRNEHESVSWFEFQLSNGKTGKKNDNHLDCIIIDDSNKRILFIEAKRFREVKQVKGIGKDVKRFYRFYDNRKEEFDERVQNSEDYDFYAMVLADVWIAKGKKRNEEDIRFKIRKSFEEKRFFAVDTPFKDYFMEVELDEQLLERINKSDIIYRNDLIEKTKTNVDCSETLYLLTATWKLSDKV